MITAALSVVYTPARARLSRTKHDILVACQKRGDRMRISVIDRGIGIPADKHESIFEAIRARDEKESEARMRKHIDEYVRYAQRKFPEALDEVIQWDRTLP